MTPTVIQMRLKPHHQKHRSRKVQSLLRCFILFSPAYRFSLTIVQNITYHKPSSTTNHLASPFAFNMYLSLPIILSGLLSYCTVFSAAASADYFRQEGYNYTTPSEITSRFSAGMACSKVANRTCILQSNGLMNARSPLYPNMTCTAVVFDIIDTFAKSLILFEESIKSRLPRDTITLEVEQNDYSSPIFSLTCYSSVIENVCFDKIPVNVPVTVSQPKGFENKAEGITRLYSTSVIVNTDEDTDNEVERDCRNATPQSSDYSSLPSTSPSQSSPARAPFCRIGSPQMHVIIYLSS